MIRWSLGRIEMGRYSREGQEKRNTTLCDYNPLQPGTLTSSAL